MNVSPETLWGIKPTYGYDAYNMDGKVLLVAGGARNLGAEIAKIGASRGAKVVISDILDEIGENTAKEICETFGTECFYKHCDISKKEEVKELVDFVVEKFGHLDCAANNAAFFQFATSIDEYDDELFDKHMQINAYGTYNLLKYETKQMVKQGNGGAICNVASTVGLVCTDKMTAYTASKHAVLGMTKNVARDLAEKNIRCNAVCPGSIWNDTVAKNWSEKMAKLMIGNNAIKRISHPNEQAQAVIFTLSDSASFMTGVAFQVDGGLLINV